MSDVTKAFLDQFLVNRKINVEVYKRIPEEKFEYRMVDTAQRKSDSPRESIIHQIYVTRNYIHAVKTGKLEWNDEIYSKLVDPKVESYNKHQLLEELNKTEHELKDLLKDPVTTVSMLYGLNDHEILHQGWNLAIMDHLNIERFPELEEMWG